MKPFVAENDLAFVALEADEKFQLIIDELTAKEIGVGAKFEQFFRNWAPDNDSPPD